MNPRDQQIAELATRTSHLDSERLASFYAKIRTAYDTASVIDRLATIDAIDDRDPSDFRVLLTQELRRIGEFNAADVHWDMYCEELGRSLASAERAYVFEILGEQVPADVGARTDYDEILNVIDEIDSNGFRADVVIVPTSGMPGFTRAMMSSIEWSDDGRSYLRYFNRRLELSYSNRAAPMDRFFVFDSSAAVWHVKLDPVTHSRITVAIGEQTVPTPGVLWLLETIAKVELTDLRAFRSFERITPGASETS